MKRLAAIVITAILVGAGCEYSPYDGDGRLVDYGPLAGTHYILELDTLTLGQRAARSYRLHGLPARRFVFGLDIDRTAAEQRGNAFVLPGNPVVRMALTDSSGRTVFAREDPLSGWTWSTVSISNQAFVYGRDPLATRLDPDPAETYLLTITISSAVTPDTAIPAKLVGKTGGWK